MTNYSYVALDVSGVRRSGQIEANDRDAAIAAIKTQGRFVVEITEQKQKAQTPAFGRGATSFDPTWNRSRHNHDESPPLEDK